ncbi:hypothetical protein [Rubrivivax gelatinosus]|uniref:Uncharacterized protein n=1 Tax=Rubrivivax gelatinosus TaxID=28068 RepID=A0ABS1E205_RUBGE|nr:hypothetical protein [Rubrivivax gelatinosus]MBK1715868.1 hypothetical protein [Rubrivivax gelatinosus]
MRTNRGLQWAPRESVGSRRGARVFDTGGPQVPALGAAHIGDKSGPACGPAAAVNFSQSNWRISGVQAKEFGRLTAGVLRTARDVESIADVSFLNTHVGTNIKPGRGTVTAPVADSRQRPDLGYSHALGPCTDVYPRVMNDRFTGPESRDSDGPAGRDDETS